MQEKKPKNQEKTVKGLNDYAKYSGLAIQMLAVMLLGVFGGIKLDKLLKLNAPVFTIVLSLLAIGLAIYLGLKDLLKIQK